MPWKAPHVSELRSALCFAVLDAGRSVADAARDFSVSRKTADKWVQRARRERENGLPLNFSDRSRRPAAIPRQTANDVEQSVLAVRKQFGWGPRKVHRYLRDQGAINLPSARTVANIFKRNGCIQDAPLAHDPIRFQRPLPNDLWQCDFKGPLEIGRQKIHPFTVLDDCSRFLLLLRPCLDLTMKTAFEMLWDAFGEHGMPLALLCDNAFGTTFDVPKTISWFEARLLRLGIDTIHGRPYHPETQGKVERLHGTLEREVWPRIRRDSLGHFSQDLERWRADVYNAVRPHEALADQTPASHWQPSSRTRPSSLPEVSYPTGSLLRKVSTSGDVRWRGYRILAGRGIVGQFVRILENDSTIDLYYLSKRIRAIDTQTLKNDIML